MTFGVFNSVAFATASGVAVAPLATVAVVKESDGLAATLYADAQGATQKASSFQADSAGRFSFYAAGIALGYKVTVTSSEGSVELRNVPVGTAMYLDESAFVSDATLQAHIDDAAGSHAASAIAFTPAGSIAATDVQAALVEVDADVTAHVGDAAAAHAASAISFSPTGSLAATDVQAALAEVDGDVATVAAALSSHLGDAADAHDASAISFAPTGSIAATDVQAAIAELGTEKADIGQIVQNSQSTAYTTVLGDAGKHLLHPAADNNPRTFTIAANASVAYAIGTAITFVNKVNTVTIAINSDTLTFAGFGTTGSRTLAANAMATALKIASTEWMISGSGLT